jgi:hypothetical protein
VHAPYRLRGGVNYAAVSAVRDTSPQALRQAGPVTASPRDDLALPAGIPGRVKQLADRLAAGHATEYDRVAAISDYLRGNYRYSVDTPRLPSGADAVDQFLFTDHVGFCEQFASALTVLLREEGIPARLAVGYGTGDHDGFTGTFTVRARDAHAWVEVLFPGTGWVPFDASPGFNGEPVAQRPARWFLSDFSPNLALVSIGGVDGRATGVLTLAVFAGVVAAMAAWRRRRRPLLREVRAYGRALWVIRRSRLPARAAWQTPLEHLVQVGTVAPPVARALEPVATAATGALYGGRRSRSAGGAISVAVAVLRYRLARS